MNDADGAPSLPTNPTPGEILFLCEIAAAPEGHGVHLGLTMNQQRLLEAGLVEYKQTAGALDHSRIYATPSGIAAALPFQQVYDVRERIPGLLDEVDGRITGALVHFVALKDDGSRTIHTKILGRDALMCECMPQRR